MRNYLVTPTSQRGLHTGRTRYRIVCLECLDLLHEATTGPECRIEEHERDGQCFGPSPLGVGSCGTCGGMKPLYHNPVGPIAQCSTCLHIRGEMPRKEVSHLGE